jgi:hypothetical protein
MSPRKAVSVKFTETFLCHSEGIISEDELKLLAQMLSENPYCGIPSKDIDNLYCLSWPQSEEGEKSLCCNIWYLAYKGVPHVEVVALTTPKEPASDGLSNRDVAWKVLRIGLLLRTLYKVYKFVRDHVDDLPHFGA